jgi:hypothetical protein
MDVKKYVTNFLLFYKWLHKNISEFVKEGMVLQLGTGTL